MVVVGWVQNGAVCGLSSGVFRKMYPLLIQQVTTSTYTCLPSLLSSALILQPSNELGLIRYSRHIIGAPQDPGIDNESWADAFKTELFHLGARDVATREKWRAGLQRGEAAVDCLFEEFLVHMANNMSICLDHRARAATDRLWTVFVLLRKFA